MLVEPRREFSPHAWDGPRAKPWGCRGAIKTGQHCAIKSGLILKTSPWEFPSAKYLTGLVQKVPDDFLFTFKCKRRLKSAAGGARKVRHLPSRRERFLAFEVKSEKFAAR